MTPSLFREGCAPLCAIRIFNFIRACGRELYGVLICAKSWLRAGFFAAFLAALLFWAFPLFFVAYVAAIFGAWGPLGEREGGDEMVIILKPDKKLKELFIRFLMGRRDALCAALTGPSSSWMEMEEMQDNGM
ncbi:MAG: hypothetical protein NC319_06585 [Butyricicoccus sp.]|nr:hypothetical protein [Butyricicoccus sp.]